MITAYRIVKKQWASSAFDGEGARLYGGRWNSQGNACVYVASSESLAILEILVHLQSAQALDSYTLLIVQLDESDVLTLDHDDLPKNWQEDPAPYETAELGDEWLASLSSLALAIPSTIVPREHNYLLNPHHPKFEALLKTIEPFELTLDKRLVQVQ